MSGLELILIFLLPFEAAGVTGGVLTLRHSAGDEVVLPCDRDSCSTVDWLFNRDVNTGTPSYLVLKGKVIQSSSAARMSVSRECSLIISSISAEDAGRYTCRSSLDGDDVVHLTVSPNQDNNKATGSTDSPLSRLTVALRVSALVLMIGVTVCLIRTRGCKKPPKDISVQYVVIDEAVNFDPTAPTLN